MKYCRQVFCSLLVTGFLMTGNMLVAAGITNSTAPRVLVYTRNFVTGGGGFVHDNIPFGVAMIQALGPRAGFTVEVSEDPKMFTPENLKRFRALIFANSNNEAFENDDQRAAFKQFIQAGGAYVGIHSACASERKWPYYWAVAGGKFRYHAAPQPFTLEVLDAKHPATAHFPATFTRFDEFYFLEHLNPRMHVVLAGDLNSATNSLRAKYPGTVFGDYFPVAWCQEYDGGRQFFTTLGHHIEHYYDPEFQQHILGGIVWALNLPLPPAASLPRQNPLPMPPMPVRPARTAETNPPPAVTNSAALPPN